MNRIFQRPSQNIMLMSILVGFYLSINTIMAYLFPSAEGGVSSGGLLGLSYVGSALLLVVISAFSGHISIRKVSLYSIILSAILVYLYQYTKDNIGDPRTLFPMFLIFAVVSLLLPNLVKVDVRLVLRTIMVLSLPALFRINVVFGQMIQTRGSISMGYSYSFLMPILVSIIYIFFYYKHESVSEKALTLACFGANMIFLVYLFAFGVRGPVFAIILLLFILYVVRVEPTARGIKIVKSKAALVFLFVILAFRFIEPILIFSQSLFSGFDLEVRFVNKFLVLLATDDMTNGRDFLNEITLNAISQKPWFGYGIDQFDNNLGLLYPHNFVLQLLYDGGVFLAGIVLVPVVIGLIKKMMVCTYNDFIILASLFFASVPGGLLSGDLWTMSTLWFFFGATLSKSLVNQTGNRVI